MVKQFFAKALLGLVLLVVLLELIVWGLSPLFVQALVKKPLADVGISLSEASSVRYNPFKSSLTIRDLVLIKSTKNPFKIKSAIFEIDLRKAISGDINVRQFEVDGLDIEIDARNNRLEVAGFELPNSSSSDESGDDLAKGILLPELSLRNSQITYVDDERAEVFYIQSLLISDGVFRPLHQKLKVDLSAQFQGSTIQVLSDINLQNSEGLISTVFDMKALNLEFVKPLLTDQGVTLHSGMLSLHAEPKVNLSKDAFSVSVEGVKVWLKGFHAEHQQQTIKIEQEVLLELNDILIRNDHITVDSVFVDSLKAALQIEPEPKGKNSSDDTNAGQEGRSKIGVPAAPSDVEAPAVSAGDNQQMTVVINSVEFRGDNTFELKDGSVNPPYERIFFIDKLYMGRLANQEAGMSPFDVKVRSNKYEEIDFKGSVAVFSDPIDLRLDGVIKEVSLPAVSSYIKGAIGFELQTGQLDSQINVSIRDAVIDGDVRLQLRGLNMQKADKELSSSLRAKTSVPLNYALGMLQDKKGNVTLKIPLKGSLDDPDFGVRSFIVILTKKAVMSAAKSYLMKTFVPYANVVSVAMAAGGHVFKLRFKDLPYSSEQVDMGEEQKKYLEQFTELMKKKKKAQVKICGVAAPTDIAGLPQPLKSDKKHYAQNISELKQVAKRRAEAFKLMAVEVGGVESARMLLCSPSVDLGVNAEPKITISI